MEIHVSKKIHVSNDLLEKNL